MARLSKSFRRAWEPGFPGEPNVKLFFTLLFWVYFSVTYLSYLLGGGREFGILPVTLAFITLLAAWLMLPWSPAVPFYRLFAAPAFAAVSFLVVHLTGFGLSTGLFSITVANGVFLFGFGRGLAYTAALVPLVFANHLWTSPEIGVFEALERTAYLLPAFAFVIGMCTMALQAIRRQEHTQALLEELEDTYAELRRYSESVRELAISEERTRMAREMHDCLGHYLTVVNVQLEAVTKLLDRNPEKARESAAQAKASASEALSEVRRSVRALRPRVMEDRVGVGALAALARDFQGTGVSVSFEVLGEEYRISPELELVLYRALQESLTNALKHSGGRRIEARLAFGPDNVRLTVTDDGRGTADSTGDRGVGLRGLEERAAAAGGTFSAGNAGGNGFVVQLELPARESG